VTPRPDPPGAQRRALTRAFFASFFDNDLTASAHDRKETFIWLMGLLAAPGFIFPFVFAGAAWGIVGLMTGTAAHFAAAFLASLFVLLAVTSAQALVVIAAGPRLAPRISSARQVVFVASMLVLMLSIPGLGTAVKNELHGAEARFTPFGIRVAPADGAVVSRLSPRLEAAPPVWFFGVYEQVVGAGQPVVPRLALRGVTATGLVLGLTLLGFPLACRRLLAGAVSDPGGFARTGRLAAAGEWLARAASREPGGRAAIQLLLATAARVPRHRFVVAAAIGATLAVALPVVLSPAPAGAATAPSSIRLLGLPFWVSALLLVGLRVVIRTPGELRAGWILAVADVPPRDIEAALRRAFLAVGVLPWVAAFTPLYWWLWGPAVALTQAALVTATGVLFSTVLLFRWSAMPCAERMARLDQGRTGRTALLALAGALWLAMVPVLSPEIAQHPRALAILVGLVTVLVIAVRVADRHVERLPRENLFDHDTAFQTLGLD